MKAAIIKKYGSAEVFEIVQIEKPVPGPKQCLIKVHTVGINPVDFKIRSGKIKMVHKVTFPSVLGFDICGEVVETGSGVRRFKVGDLIYGGTSRGGGGYAEYAIVDESAIVLKPARLTEIEAASLPVAALTALQALRDKGNLESGQNLLVIGASGGVGHFAVQIAKAMGASVTAVCSGANIGWVRELNPDRVIDYWTTDYQNESVEYDIIFDAVGVNSFLSCRRILKAGGVYITALPSFSFFVTSPFVSLFSSKQSKLIMERTVREDLEYLNQLAQENRLKPRIEKIFPLEKIADAHRHLETGRTKGKVVVQI